MKRTGPTNPYLKSLIENLKKKSFELNAPIWRAVAEKLEKPRRQRVEVNISDLERVANENEYIVVPGVVLGSGDLSKKLVVAAWKFSPTAKQKIEKMKGECLSIDELVERNPKGSGVRIVV